jgi:hypothetical protein
MTSTLSIAAEELVLCSENNSVYYPQIVRTLGKFHRNGTFSKDRALPYIHRYLLMPVARDQVGSQSTAAVNAAFPRADRLAAAEAISDGLVCEFRMGNYW